MRAARLRRDAPSALRQRRTLRHRSSVGADGCRDAGNPATNRRARASRAGRIACITRAHYTSRVKEGSWQTISSERHFANAYVEVVTDRVRTPARSQPRTWTIVRRKPAVIIAPMTRDGKIVLIHQERIPIRAAIWEMPSGQIDNSVAGDRLVAGIVAPGRASETVEQVALRELREEAGYELARDGRLIALGHYFSSPGFTDELGYFFLARPVQQCKEA